jgi:hypothetical protein
MMILKKPSFRRFALTITLIGLLIASFMMFVKIPENNPFARGQTQLSGPNGVSEGLFPDISIVPPNLQIGSAPTVELKGFTYSFQIKKDAPLPNKLCIDNISIVQTAPGSGWFGHVGFYKANYPFCFELVRPALQSSDGFVLFDLVNPNSAGDLTTELFDTNSHFRYPYDDFELSLGLELSYRVLHNDQVLLNEFIYPQFFASVPTSIDWITQASEVDVSSTFVEQGYDTDMKILTTLAFARPIFMKIIYPLLITVMAFFILLLSLVDSVDTFIEGGVAVFFGIFGLKQIILPATTEITTVWDFAIWGLVIAFAAALIDHLISGFRRVLRSRDEIRPSNEIKTEKLLISAPPSVGTSAAKASGPSNENIGVVTAIIGIAFLGWIFSRIFHRGQSSNGFIDKRKTLKTQTNTKI